MTAERAPEPGEVCNCGRPAVTVFVRADGRAVPWCGIPDGGLNADRPGNGRADTPIEGGRPA